MMWPCDEPYSLEEMCYSECVNNLNNIMCRDWSDHYVLPPGVMLPKSCCERLIVALMDSNRPVDDSVINIFADTGQTRLNNARLRHSSISSKGLKSISRQPLTVLDLSHCLNLTEDCLELINRLGDSLRSLRLEGTPKLFGNVNNMDLGLENDDEIHGTFKQDYIFKTPNLKSLCIRDVPFSNLPEGNDMVSTLLYPLKQLTHLDFSCCKLDLEFMDCLDNCDQLISLTLADVPITEIRLVFQIIGRLKKLRHLDVSQSQEGTPKMFETPEDNLRYLVQNLPMLTSLDLSGTNLAGYVREETKSHRPGVRESKSSMFRAKEPNSPLPGLNGDSMEEQMDTSCACCIPGLEGRQFEFLGLLGCAYSACTRSNIPGRLVTGDANQEQILLSVKAYIDHCDLLNMALNNLFRCFRHDSKPIRNHCAVLEGLLLAMKHHLLNMHVQISASASLFYIVKGKQRRHITYKQRRRIINALLDAMENHLAEQTMIRNGILTFFHFKIPQHVLFCYERLVDVLLQVVQMKNQVEAIERLTIHLLNCLACQVDGYEKRLLGELGAMQTMLRLIRKKIYVLKICDEPMEVAWSMMWNVTDETPSNCEMFMDCGGMNVFLHCLKNFPNKPELLRNMMGLMGNIAEVKELRSRLRVDEYITVFSDLLDSESDGIEVSYNAAGVLAHLASDGRAAWTVDTPSIDEVLARMVKAIDIWDIHSKRNINYRSFMPILKLIENFEVPEVQHWATWALCNLTNITPGKYVPLLLKEGGLSLLQAVVADSRPYKRIHELTSQVIERLENYHNGICTYETEEDSHQIADQSSDESD